MKSKTIYSNYGSGNAAISEPSERKPKAFSRPSKDKDDPDSQAVMTRFWMAFDKLKHDHGWGWQAAFIRSVNEDDGHFLRLRKVQANGPKMRIALLVAIVRDWAVNPEWLLTGRGKMFKG